jgi:ligand-binding SRPBCC domain-containing protein
LATRLRREISFEHWVQSPLERVFRFFADPCNLPRIMPPTSQTRIVRLELQPPLSVTDHNLAGPGSRIVTSFRVFPWLPFRTLWIARITECALEFALR